MSPSRAGCVRARCDLLASVPHRHAIKGRRPQQGAEHVRRGGKLVVAVDGSEVGGRQATRTEVVPRLAALGHTAPRLGLKLRIDRLGVVAEVAARKQGAKGGVRELIEFIPPSKKTTAASLRPRTREEGATDVDGVAAADGAGDGRASVETRRGIRTPLFRGDDRNVEDGGTLDHELRARHPRRERVWKRWGIAGSDDHLKPTHTFIHPM